MPQHDPNQPRPAESEEQSETGPEEPGPRTAGPDRAAGREERPPASEAQAAEAADADEADEAGAEPGEVGAAPARGPDPDRLPIALAIARLREQMEDPAWAARDVVIALALTIDADPAGIPISEAFPGRIRRPRETGRAWRRVQQAAAASPLGRSIGVTVDLVPGGGRFHAVLTAPCLDDLILVRTPGARSPLGALRAMEQLLVRSVAEAGARIVAERERAGATGGPAPTPPDSPGATPDPASAGATPGSDANVPMPPAGASEGLADA